MRKQAQIKLPEVSHQESVPDCTFFSPGPIRWALPTVDS